MMKREWGQRLIKPHFQQRLREINRYRKDDLEEGEDSDGKPVFTNRQKLGRVEAVAALDDILFQIRPDRLEKLRKGCLSQMQKVLFREYGRLIITE